VNRAIPALTVVALGAIVALGTWLAATATTSDPNAPPFSRRIAGAYPGTPFITCDLGQHDTAADGTSVPHRWYVRPASSGELHVEAFAIGGNPAEGGSLVAELFDPRGASLGTTHVTYPSGATATRPTVGSLSAMVARGAIHLLEVRILAAAGLAQAHHYRLGFSGVPVEVGVNSPALPHWLEGLNFGRQLFHVTLDADEELRLDLTAGEGQPVPSFTIELRTEDDALLTTRTWTTRDAFEVVLPPAHAARTVRIITWGNHHFTLAKSSGTDRGIYFDACPSPATR
jgi:hypothetical protein